MNIVKLKDIVMPAFGDSELFTPEQIDLFNNKLKGKYAYWVQMRYIVPLDEMCELQYINCEQDGEKELIKYNIPYLDIYDSKCIGHNCGLAGIYNYVNEEETNKINAVGKWENINQYTTDDDITLDEIKKFRTWLATQLLKFDQDNKGNQLMDLYDDKITHMLQYYKNGMYDDIVRYLSIFGKTEPEIITAKPVCGACGPTNLASLYTDNLINCDALVIYRKNIYELMTITFMSLDFWLQFPKEFILEFKKYIDNIIKCNLSLGSPIYVSDYVDCNCPSIDIQKENLAILQRLSNALGYIYDEDLSGHKNFSADAFKEWSVKLYELMEW